VAYAPKCLRQKKLDGLPCIRDVAVGIHYAPLAPAPVYEAPACKAHMTTLGRAEFERARSATRVP
jgi:hypothetical protein